MGQHLTFSTPQGYMLPAAAEGSQRTDRLHCRPLTITSVEAVNNPSSFLWVLPVQVIDRCAVVAWKRGGNGIPAGEVGCERLMQAIITDPWVAQSGGTILIQINGHEWTTSSRLASWNSRSKLGGAQRSTRVRIPLDRTLSSFSFDGLAYACNQIDR